MLWLWRIITSIVFGATLLASTSRLTNWCQLRLIVIIDDKTSTCEHAQIWVAKLTKGFSSESETQNLQWVLLKKKMSCAEKENM
jgi:hypothetical protein